LPGRERDRDQIVRWRFEHEEHVAVGDARIVHRVFPVQGRSPSQSTEPQSDGGVEAFVLGLAIQRSVLEQYEQICEHVGLLPVVMSCATIWLFDFYRPLFPRARELFFVHQAEDSITFMAIRHGIPVFLRTKGWRSTEAVQRGDDQAAIADEVLSTQQYYRDLFPDEGTGPDSPPVSIYMVGESTVQPGRAEGSPVSGTTFEKETPMSRVPSPVQLIQPRWTSLVNQSEQSIHTEAGLGALACAVGQ
jgi:hypothetical protein